MYNFETLIDLIFDWFSYLQSEENDIILVNATSL